MLKFPVSKRLILLITLHAACTVTLWAQGPAADTFPIETDVSCAAASGQPPNNFHVRLTPQQEERALSLYRSAIVITAHDHCLHPDDFKDVAKAGITARVIKPLTDGYFRRGPARFPIDNPVDGWAHRGTEAIAILQSRADNSHGEIRIVRTVGDIENAKRDGAQGIILSFEGGRPLQGDLQNLSKFHDLGLRELQLYWAVTSPLKNPDGTLSAFGEDVIRNMDRLGIVLDISHMQASSFRRALEISKNPVVISHCAVTFKEHNDRPSTDGLDDDTIRAIAAHGGVICMHFMNGYIHPRHGTQYATVEDLVDHIDRIRQVAGIDYVGLGPDYSPMQGWRWVEGAERFEGIPNVAREMVRRGYSDEEIRKVLGLNLMRVYRKVWGN
jgi:membrane dipeptidase